MPTQPLRISDRLDRLEKENRNLKRGFVGFVLVAAVTFIAGAVPSGSEEVEFGTIQAKRLTLTDSDGAERLILELQAGEPTLTMLNHDGDPQVYLGIDEAWDDSAYLALSSRLENGAIEKQAVLVATPSRKKGAAGFGKEARAGNSQLLLFDLKPHGDDNARHLMRLSSGGLDTAKPYIEVRDVQDLDSRQLDFKLLTAGPSDAGERVVLDSAKASSE